MGSVQQINIKSTEFQPKNEYILIKPETLNKSEKKSESGFIIEATQNTQSFKRPTAGVVMAVGSDIKDIFENDYIMWPETDGLDIEFLDSEYVLMRYQSVIGTKRS